MEATGLERIEALACRCCGVNMCRPALLQKLGLLMDAFQGLKITSGYRCIKHNIAVGGAPRSKHVLGLAVDIATTPETQGHIIATARKLGFKGIGKDRAGMFVHLDIRPYDAYWEYPLPKKKGPETVS